RSTWEDMDVAPRALDLLDVGHRSIMHLTTSERWTIQQRQRGFLAAIEQVEGARGDIHVLPRGSTEAGEHFIREFGLAALSRYTAISCFNDLVAAGVLQALETAAVRVPDTISLIGFDNLSFAALFTPRLATMHVDRVELGREAVRLALGQLADPERPPRQVEIAVQYVEGGSIGPVHENENSVTTDTTTIPA
ncbi:MAG: substrate-binding domain-containing protein, partial [Pseudomonadota bacterium]